MSDETGLRKLDPCRLTQVEEGEQVVVVGRVLLRQADAIALGDAFGAVRLRIEQGDASLGDLVGCVVVRESGILRVSRWLWKKEAPEPRGGGDALRLSGERARLVAFASRARSIMRSYFEDHDFLEVQTPTLVPCPGLDAHVHSLGSVPGPGGQSRYLTTSPEFAMKRLLVSGLPRIYQLARCFRAEEQGPWHEPEFTLLEWYRANGTWKETMSDTEELVRRIVEAARQAGFDRVPGLPEGPFLRLTVAEAFERYADGADALVLAARDEDEYYETLVQRVEPALAALGEPVFLTHYPLSQAALSRPCPESPHLAERYELYFQGVELCNGFGELTDSQQQRRRFEQERTRRSDAGEDCYPLDERFLGALEEGLLPCSGNALGVDRLIAVAAGAQALRDVLPFDSSEI